MLTWSIASRSDLQMQRRLATHHDTSCARDKISIPAYISDLVLYLFRSQIYSKTTFLARFQILRGRTDQRSLNQPEMLTFDSLWTTTKPRISLIWQGLNGVEKLICQGSPSSFPTASFAKCRSAWLIPAICFYTFYIGARDTLVTFDDAWPTSSDGTSPRLRLTTLYRVYLFSVRACASRWWSRRALSNF